MRKLSLFIVVAIIATMFVFVATPVSATGEDINFLFKASTVSNYDYTLTVQTTKALNVATFTLAYDNKSYSVVGSDGVVIPTATTMTLSNSTSVGSKVWVRSDLTYVASGDGVNTNSTIVSAKNASALYDVMKVSFNNGTGGTSDAIPSGDLLKFYIKKVGTPSTTVANAFKLVGTDATQQFTDIAISPTVLNTGLATGKYTVGNYGANKSGVTLGTTSGGLVNVLRAQVAWSEEVAVNNKITASIGANGSVSVNGTPYTGEVDLGAATTATISITPNSGYEIDTATFDGADIKSAIVGGIYNATGITGTKALVVTFKAIVIPDNKITASIGANGSVSVNGTPYTGEVNLGAATTATISITPNSGYEIDTATFGGADIKSAIVGGIYNATGITGTKALAVTFKAIVIPDNKITASITGSGKVVINGQVVANGGEVNLGTATAASIKVLPAMGFEIQTATLNGNNISSDKDGFIYDATVSGAQALVINFAANRSEPEKPQGCKAVFKNDAFKPEGSDKTFKARTTFAKKPTTGTILEFGVKLTDSNNVEVVIPGGVGAMYKSTVLASGSGQYGIQFVGLPDGTYKATPYAIVEGTPNTTVYGTAVTFTVGQEG